MHFPDDTHTEFAQSKIPRVLHVIGPVIVGGLEKYVAELVRAAGPAFEHEILSVVEHSDSAGIHNRRFEPFAQILRCFVLSNAPLYSPRFALCNTVNAFWRWLQVPRMLRRLRGFDIVHIHTNRYTRFLLHACGRAGIRAVVMTIHGDEFSDERARRVLAYSARGRIVVVALCEELRQRFARALPEPCETRVIRTGCEIQQQLPVPATRSARMRFGLVTRLEPGKGLELLPAIADSLAREKLGATIVIFGEGVLRSFVQGVADRHPGIVTVKGAIENQEDIYSNIDRLLMLSESEGMPMTVLEAFEHSIRVLSTRVGCLARMRENRLLRFVEGNAESIVSAIRMELSDTAGAGPAQVPAQDTPEQSNEMPYQSTDAWIREYEALYRQLMDGRR